MSLRNLALPTNLGFNVPEIEDITDQLPKNKNYTWEQFERRRSPEECWRIGVHHSGMARSQGCTAASHASSHINTPQSYAPKGEPGIPYHIYIRDGRIFQTNDLLDLIYGIASFNTNTVHICVEGNFLVDVFTEMDRLCLYAAIMSVKAVLPIKETKGHNELNATSCPAIDMNRVRRDVETLEHKMKQASTWDGKLEQIKSLYNQINYMTNLMGNGQNDGDAQWAANQLLEVVAIMKARNLL